MNRIWTKLAIAIAAVFTVAAAPAMAQATRTWVSGVGDDANPCSRTAPCKTFAGAISKTAAGGEINALDPGGFGGVTITKSITIRSDGVEAGVLVSGTNAIVINAAATDRIVLDGLDFEGLGTGLSGVNIIQARDVLVRNSIFRNFTTAGILLNTATTSALMVENSTFFNNTYGIRVTSTGSSTARIYENLIGPSGTAGIGVNGVTAKAEISGNQIHRSPKSLEILGGGTISSYGDNVLGAGDAPTIVPKG